jgi:putrescine transport system substrate-binding protein
MAWAELTMRRVVVVCVLALAAMPAFGQGTVNVYNFSNYLAVHRLKDFEKQTGLKVNYSTYDTDEILDAKLKSGRSLYDVVVPSASPFFARQRAAGLYRRLDRSKLKNWNNLDPEIVAQLAKYDPGNAHAIPWMWGTTGIGYNVEEIKKRMPDAPVDSLRLLFDPAVVSKFKDCGVRMVNSPTDVIPAALKYLGLDTDTKKREDLEKAADAVKAILPYIRFDSATYHTALEKGEACLVLGYSGDILEARKRAADKRDLVYVIPKEGGLVYLTVAAIPRDPPNPDGALRFLDFLMEPEVDRAKPVDLSVARGARAALHQCPRNAGADAGPDVVVDRREAKL